MTTCTPAICWSHKDMLGRRCERHLTKSSFKLTCCPLDFVTTLMSIRHKEVVLRSLLKRSMQLLRTIRVVKWLLVFLITCIACIRGDLWRLSPKLWDGEEGYFWEKSLRWWKSLLRYSLCPQNVLWSIGLKWVWPWTDQSHTDRNKNV